MTVLSLKIKDIFNYLATHLHDDFSRLNGTTFSTYFNKMDMTSIIEYNNNLAFNLNHLSIHIATIFDKLNFLELGENSIRLVEYIKTNQNKLSTPQFKWISKELADFCLNANTTPTSTILNEENLIIPPTPSSQGNNSNSGSASHNTNDNSSNLQDNQTFSSFLHSMRSNLNSDLQSQFKVFIHNSMPKSVKDEHYQELETLINKKVMNDNDLAINKSYLSNKIVQKSINKNNFPKPWKTDDPIFIDKYDKLINAFQIQIQELNINHIEEKLSSLNEEIANKTDFIKNFDTNAINKCRVLEERITLSHKASLIKSNEKVNRLITSATTSNDIQDNSSHKNISTININNKDDNSSKTSKSYQQSYFKKTNVHERNRNRIHNNNQKFNLHSTNKFNTRSITSNNYPYHFNQNSLTTEKFNQNNNNMNTRYIRQTNDHIQQ